MSIKVPGCQDLKVLGFKGDKGNKVTRVTRVPRLKGLLRDRVFSRTHLRSSLTPEEGPSCFQNLPGAVKTSLQVTSLSVSAS